MPQFTTIHGEYQGAVAAHQSTDLEIPISMIPHALTFCAIIFHGIGDHYYLQQTPLP
jgi:hypothetical protein